LKYNFELKIIDLGLFELQLGQVDEGLTEVCEKFLVEFRVGLNYDPVRDLHTLYINLLTLKKNILEKVKLDLASSAELEYLNIF
jgi:hypothetical protein